MNRKTKILITVSIIILISIIIIKLRKESSNPVNSISTAGLEIPLYESSDQIIRHTAYTLQYNEANEQPDWVAYFLTSSRLSGNAGRTDNFREDSLVTTGSAQLDDYKRTGYDRGHMAPAGDFKWSQNAMSESFLLSNMSPQIHAFNAGIWEALENQVRSWAAADGDTIFIAAGPVLKTGLPAIGARKKLTVPEYYYKALLRKSSRGLGSVAFLMRHEKSSKPLSAFAITVDSLEQVTGINFFSRLPAAVQAEVESKIDLTQWPGINAAEKQLRKKMPVK